MHLCSLKVILGILLASLLAACGKPSGPHAPPADDHSALAPVAARFAPTATRDDVVRAHRCLALLSAIAAARAGVLSSAVENAGLGDIEPAVALRWITIADGYENGSGLPQVEINAIAEQSMITIESADKLVQVAPEAHACTERLRNERP